MKIEGSVVVVTGAGSGIGRALAESFAAAGASVVAGDIDGAGASETAARIAAAGGRAVGVEADAASVDGIATLIACAGEEFGPVDVYVANAGVIGAPGLGDDADWDRIIDVNLRAHVRAAKALVPEWLERGSGYFVACRVGGRPAHADRRGRVLGDEARRRRIRRVVGNHLWRQGNRRVVRLPDGRRNPAAQRAPGFLGPCGAAGRHRGRQRGRGDRSGQGRSVDGRGGRGGRFLVLPHPEVLDMYRQKGSDYERWIAGMRRYQGALG